MRGFFVKAGFSRVIKVKSSPFFVTLLSTKIGFYHINTDVYDAVNCKYGEIMIHFNPYRSFNNIR
ncbi:hypothetical protein KCTC52924_01178 [Arenibacter antarcticus]